MQKKLLKADVLPLWVLPCLPGVKKKSFVLPFRGGEIWFEHLDGMYQYTDRKTFSSYGPYDANVVFKDYPTIVKTYGFNGYSSAIDEEEETPAPDECRCRIELINLFYR